MELKWTINAAMKAQVDARLAQTNWDALRSIASRARDGTPCEVLPQCATGGSFLARLLRFDDGTVWLARVQLRGSTPGTVERLRQDLDATAFVGAQAAGPTGAPPVPRIFAAELDDANPTGSAFALLEFLPGNTAADEVRGVEAADWGVVPHLHRERFHRSMAAAQVQIASARLPQIGTVRRLADGTFAAGPITGIGGPFDTAASFIEAWTANTRFPYGDHDVRRLTPPGTPPALVAELLQGIRSFPNRLAELADKLFTREGPFPVRHPDLILHNVVVTADYDVLGVVDWEGNCAVPWELVDGPRFVSTVPRRLDPPGLYDADGTPLDPERVVMLADEGRYAAMVFLAEDEAGANHKLSEMLRSGDARDLAGSVHLFAEGKMGLYGRALDYFERS